MEFKNPSWNSLVIPISMVTVVFWIAIARDQTNKLTFFTWFFLFPRCSWKFQNPIVDFVWFLKNICRSTSENHKITMFGFSYIVEPTISMQIPHLNIHGILNFHESYKVLVFFTIVRIKFLFSRKRGKKLLLLNSLYTGVYFFITFMIMWLS